MIRLTVMVLAALGAVWFSERLDAERDFGSVTRRLAEARQWFDGIASRSPLPGDTPDVKRVVPPPALVESPQPPPISERVRTAEEPAHAIPVGETSSVTETARLAQWPEPPGGRESVRPAPIGPEEAELIRERLARVMNLAQGDRR